MTFHDIDDFATEHVIAGFGIFFTGIFIALYISVHW